MSYYRAIVQQEMDNERATAECAEKEKRHAEDVDVEMRVEVGEEERTPVVSSLHRKRRLCPV